MIRKIRKAIKAIQSIGTLEKKISLLNNELRILVPEVIPADELFRGVVENFEKKHNISGKVNYSISKNDLMFRYACYHVSNMNKAVEGYFETGLNPSNIISRIIEGVYGSEEEPKSILDFASGYGRVTRFLTAKFGTEKVWASEVKPKALAFIEDQFNCRTIQSSFVPEEFKPEQKFDVIYVGSLFSHLPEDLFNRWLLKLYNSITDKGILILSTHDISLLNKSNKNAFVFVKDSEDQLFSDVDDHIEDVNTYGATFIGINKVKELFRTAGIKEGQYFRFKRVLSNVQDVYVISRNELSFIAKPDLSIYP